MPAADFSEFSYGYAVVRQAEDLLATIGAGLVGAPTLPSLLKENTVGYDAELVAVDFALFLQFKRSFFVSRQHTQGPCGYVGGEPHCTWAYWNTEHYRFDVDTDSNQFHAMRGYETSIALGYGKGLSLYLAPAFHKETDLHLAYTGGLILDRSVAIRPSAFDTVTAGQHKYSFDLGMTAGVVTSEPAPVDPKTATDAITAAANTAIAERPTEPLTLAALGSWAANQSSAAGLDLDVDRRSAPDTLALLNDFAGLLGASLTLLGRQDETLVRDANGGA